MHTTAPCCPPSPGTPPWHRCTHTRRFKRGQALTGAPWHSAEHIAGSHKPVLTRTRRDAAGLFVMPPSCSTSASISLPRSSLDLSFSHRRWTGNARVPLANAHGSLTKHQTLFVFAWPMPHHAAVSVSRALMRVHTRHYRKVVPCTIRVATLERRAVMRTPAHRTRPQGHVMRSLSFSTEYRQT